MLSPTARAARLRASTAQEVKAIHIDRAWRREFAPQVLLTLSGIDGNRLARVALSGGAALCNSEWRYADRVGANPGRRLHYLGAKSSVLELSVTHPDGRSGPATSPASAPPKGSYGNVGLRPSPDLTMNCPKGFQNGLQSAGFALPSILLVTVGSAGCVD
jgi:hypothetical protein